MSGRSVTAGPSALDGPPRLGAPSVPGGAPGGPSVTGASSAVSGSSGRAGPARVLLSVGRVAGGRRSPAGSPIATFPVRARPIDGPPRRWRERVAVVTSPDRGWSGSGRDWVVPRMAGYAGGRASSLVRIDRPGLPGPGRVMIGRAAVRLASLSGWSGGGDSVATGYSASLA